MGIIALLYGTFLSEIAGAVAGGAGGLIGGGMRLDEIRFLYYSAVLIQAIGSGLVAGVLGEGSIPGGLKHGFLMVIVAYVTFTFLI